MGIGSQTEVIKMNINILLYIRAISIKQIIIGRLFLITSIFKNKKDAQAFSQLDEYNKGGATQHNLLWKAMGNIEDALKELEDE